MNLEHAPVKNVHKAKKIKEKSLIHFALHAELNNDKLLNISQVSNLFMVIFP